MTIYNSVACGFFFFSFSNFFIVLKNNNEQQWYTECHGTFKKSHRGWEIYGGTSGFIYIFLFNFVGFLGQANLKHLRGLL